MVEWMAFNPFPFSYYGLLPSALQIDHAFALLDNPDGDIGGR